MLLTILFCVLRSTSELISFVFIVPKMNNVIYPCSDNALILIILSLQIYYSNSNNSRQTPSILSYRNSKNDKLFLRSSPTSSSSNYNLTVPEMFTLTVV